MRFLRTAPTRRLLTVLSGLLAGLLVVTAIALAAVGSGPVPAPKALPQAIHDALAAPAVSGISARISFTNHLISSTDLGEGTSPILDGATGRLWLSPATHQLRIELQGDSGDAEVLVENRSFWISDPSSHTVYEGTLPAGRSAQPKPTGTGTVPSVAQISRRLARGNQHLDVSGAQPTDVAGEPAYEVSVSPRTHPGLLGAVSLTWDALHGTPLRLAITAQGSSDPVLELTATNISFGPVAPSVFAISPPTGDTVSHVTFPARDAAHPSRDEHGHLITRGQGLDGIAIIETPAHGAKKPASSQERGGMTLPTVSVNGVTAQELQTPLGTLIRFTRGATTYTVIGSQPPAKVLAAARDL